METNSLETGKTLTCVTCNSKFVFTTGEQEYFKQRNLAEPRRCKECRERRKRVDGVFGSRVVIVDSMTDLVLCNKCRNPASKTASLAKGEAVCQPCSGFEASLSPSEDFLVYEDWRRHKGQNPYVT